MEAVGTSAKGWESLRDQLACRIDDIMAGRALTLTEAAPSRGPAPVARRPDPAPAPEEPPSIWLDQAVAREADQAAGPEVPASPIPAYLPPPVGAGQSALVAWGSGRVWHPDTMRLTLDESELDFDDLTALERDNAGAGTAERFFARPGVRPR